MNQMNTYVTATKGSTSPTQVIRFSSKMEKSNFEKKVEWEAGKRAVDRYREINDGFMKELSSTPYAKDTKSFRRQINLKRMSKYVFHKADVFSEPAAYKYMVEYHKTT